MPLILFVIKYLAIQWNTIYDGNIWLKYEIAELRILNI